MCIVKPERTLIHGYRPYIKRRSYPAVRCSFWLLAWANGCLYNCAYCWLKAYHGRWPWNEIHVTEKSVPAKVLQCFCSKTPVSQLLNAGELCDSFVVPEYIPYMASTLREANEEYGCRLSLYNELVTVAKDHGVPAVLCKEPSEVWEKLGLRGPCNYMTLGA